MKLRTLTTEETEICKDSIGPQAFYGLVVDALLRKEPLSIIRVSDGERGALEYANAHSPEDPLLCFDQGYRVRFGCEGITCGAIYDRIWSAAMRATYLAPSFGFFNPAYNLYDYFPRPARYVEGMFQYEWPARWKATLMLEAGSVLVINRDQKVVDKMRYDFQISLRKNRFNPEHKSIRFENLYLDNWLEAEAVLQKAKALKPRLTLMSAGLASKWIGPELAKETNGVVLDIGQAADVWLD